VRRTIAIAAIAAILFLGVFLVPNSPTVSGAPVLEAYMTGLDFPVALAFSPDGRIFFAEIFTGNIWVIENGLLLPDPLYTLPNTAAFGEMGLLGLALHPQFSSEPWIYAYQTFNDTTSGTFYNRVVRIRAPGNIGVFHEVILDQIPAATLHNGGIIGFGPDGKLYATTGDSTKNDVQAFTPQDLNSLAGKVLRMNPDGTVPADNPFAGDPNANPYIYTYGHRNPFGLTFHPATGNPYITENGPDCNDEVNLLVPGGNFGWGPSQTCDTSVLPYPQNTNQDGPIPILPIAWYTPVTAPVNAAVYIGTKFSAWRGDLIMGEFNTASLRRLDLEPPNYDAVVGEEVILTVPEPILDVESAPDGAIWFTTPTTIYRFFESAQPPKASFTATPARVGPGVPAVFDASASVDPDGTIVSYSWTFGDGAVGSGAVTTHAYSASGTYPVTLTVVDDESNQDVATGSIIVNSAPIIISKFPTASIILELNLSTTLTIFVSDADDDSLTYIWQVNGVVAPSNGRSFEFRAGAEGTYSVTVTVSDGSLSDSDEWIVAVVGRGTASPPFVWWIPALVVIGGVSIILALWLWRRQR